MVNRVVNLSPAWLVGKVNRSIENSSSAVRANVKAFSVWKYEKLWRQAALLLIPLNHR